MQHIYFEFDEHKYYVELNNQRYAVRQITQFPSGRISLSSHENTLAENQMTIDEDEVLISEEKFDELWFKELAVYADEWEKTKAKYPLNTKVTGVVQYFYPQGIICDIDGVLAITIDDAYMPDDVMLYPDDVLDGVVIGYDEENMWVKFESESSKNTN